jgi:hypothetical protein
MALFLPNPLLEAELEKGLDMTDPANAVAEVARSIAPVDTGRYAASIHVETDGEGAKVVADVPYAIFVEIGTFKDDAQHVLTRAVEQTGLHLGAR